MTIENKNYTVKKKIKGMLFYNYAERYSSHYMKKISRTRKGN